MATATKPRVDEDEEVGTKNGGHNRLKDHSKEGEELVERKAATPLPKGVKAKDVIVRKKDGTPDLRIKAHRQKFLHDATKKIDGSPDERLLENRPDLLAYKASKMQNRSNVTFEERPYEDVE